jgi:hypothetical protein
MQHLLLTRFQGALIGANTIYLTPQQIAPNQLFLDASPALMGGIASLIRRGGFDAQDWRQSTFTTAKDFRQAIVTMLPLMLFFHDDRVKLRETLINVSHGWELDWETCSSAVAIGYIISRSLTESLSPRTVIPQLLDETNNLHPLLFEQLDTIDLAIYCFLSTPEDFSLAILRARHTQSETSFTCALTGILAGGYNSLTGIPLNGVIATQERAGWLLASESLLIAWAGVYHEHSLRQPIGLLPASSQPPVAYVLPVASPQVIQRRD